MEILCQQDFRESIDTDFFNIRSDFYSTSITDDGIVIDDKTFRHNNLSHMKRSHTLLDINAIFKTPQGKEKELLVECNLSARQFFRNSDLIPKIPSQYINRIVNIHEDPRLCCAGFYAFEDENNMSYMFLITNGMIYALYGREMELVKSEDEYSEKDPTYKINKGCFYSLIPLRKRGFNSLTPKDGPLSEFTILSMGFTTEKVTWYINKEPIHTINNIGYRQPDMYSVVEHGGLSIKSENNKLRIGFGHFSFLDFQLPNNYSRQMTSIEILNGCRVERSCSGLAQLYPTEYYKEIYQNTLGKNVNIIPEKTFAIGYEEGIINSNYLLFGQGMVTIVKTVFVCYRSLDQVKTPQINFEGNNFDRKKVPKTKKPRESIKKKSPKIIYSSESESESDSEIPCPNKKTPTNKDFSIQSGLSVQSSLTSSETIDCPENNRKPIRNIGFDRENLKNIKQGKISESTEPIYSHNSINRKNSETEKTEKNESNSDSTIDSDSDSGFISMDKIRRKSKRIEISDSLETIGVIGSLESIGESLGPKSHSICWICGKNCQGMCCGGNCGSKCCKNLKTKAPIIKGMSAQRGNEKDMKYKGRPLKFPYHSNRFK